jgi:hypothetical protein
MSLLEDAAREASGLFSPWRREQPKRPLKDSERSAWVCRVLVRADDTGAPVRVQYRLENAPMAETVGFVPIELYARGASVYVDGKSYPRGEALLGLRVERSFDARIERPASEARSKPGGAGEAVPA